MQQQKKKHYVRKMYQTDKYKLNMIEPSDTFSPDPLNENMEKVEAQFDAVRAEAAADTTALDERITVLEGRKIVLGSYEGDGRTIFEFPTGGTPKLVIVKDDEGASIMALPDSPMNAGGAGPRLFIIDGGFQAYGTYNTAGHSYHYLAII